MNILPFVEAFGPTLQGEGAAAGRNASFLRFGGCNLSCSWCDSAYTWDASLYNLREQVTLLRAEEILERVPEAPLYIVTGGEPLLHQHNEAFMKVLIGLKSRGAEVHMETNGTILPRPEVRALVDVFNVSPKQAHAGEHKRSQDPALHPGWVTVHDWAECHLKVVVEDAAGVAQAKALAEEHQWPLEHTWVMPEGTTAAVLAERWPVVATAAAELGINATHRLHVLAWTDARGH